MYLYISPLPLPGLGTGGSVKPGGILKAKTGQPGDPFWLGLCLQATLGCLDDVLQPPTEAEAGEEADLLPDDPPLPGQAGGETPVPPELDQPGPGPVVVSPLAALQSAVLALAAEPVAPGQVLPPLRAAHGPLALQEVVVAQSELLPSRDRGHCDHLEPPGGEGGIWPDPVVTVTAAGVVQTGGGEEDSTEGVAGQEALSQLETVGAEDTCRARTSVNLSAPDI